MTEERPVGEGRIYENMRIQFDPQNRRNKIPFGAVRMNQEISFRITVCSQPEEARPQSGSLWIRRDGEDASRQVNAVRKLEENEVWELGENELGKLEADNAWKPRENDFKKPVEDGDVRFVFHYIGDESGLYFYRFSVSFSDGQQEESPEFQLTLYGEDYQSPDWLKKGLMYQIFPDRFARSENYTPPKQNKRYTLRSDWGGIPQSGPDGEGMVWNDDFFGGNLKGITEHLDQLQEMGVTVLYLNPIFSAFSNHRYDTADYLHIDPMLGTEQDLTELCGEAAHRGIRIVLDGVFNHTGCDSIYFNKYGRFPGKGAYQSEESPYFPWYTFTDYPDEYDCWWGILILPTVKKTESSYLEYVLTGSDSVVRHWMRCGVSGFRLDVADELPDSFLDTLRQVVKEENPQAAVIGEVWEDASNKISYGKRRRYFQGKQLDSVMNYPMKEGIIQFVLGKSSAHDLEKLLGTLQEHYPAPAFSSLMNILGTHDTARIFTVLTAEEGIGESEWGKKEEMRRLGRSRLFLALMIWAFLPGIPCIYYGDELGMEGGRDPQNRRCYMFENRDQLIYDFYRRLLRFRGEVIDLEGMELSVGDWQSGEAGSGCFRFQRIGTDSRLVIQINSDTKTSAFRPTLSDGERILNFLTAGLVDFSDLCTFHLSPGSGAVVLISSRPLNDSSVSR